MSEANKEKLTISHIAPYLPYGIQVEWAISMPVKPHYRHITLTGVEICNGDVFGHDAEAKYSLEESRLFLRPLSDINSAITHNGERFVPSKELERIGLADSSEFKFDGNDFIWDYETDFCSDNYGNQFHSIWIPLSNQFAIWQKLLEWHFDLFGLLEKDLAIPKY